MTARLTIGWQQAGRAATLAEHAGIYGPLPRPAPGRLLDAVSAAGLTGRGGACFATAVKMRGVAAGRGPAVVVANGMESEPASQKDQALMSRAPHLVLDGAALAAEAVGADEIHLCLPRARPWLTSLMAESAGRRQQAGLDRVPVQVQELPDRYTSGEETALVQWLSGGAARPMNTPPRPADKGVRRRPTLVDNVETLAHMALIARFGPAWFRQAGQPGAPGTMLVTISGAVASPGVYEIELGTPVSRVLAMAGASGQAPAVLLGGYGGTWHDPRDLADLPMTGRDLDRAGAALGAGVVAVLPPGCCVLAETARLLGYLARHGAGQCGPCVFGLPAIAGDFARLASGRADRELLGRLDRRLGVIAGRGACRHPDGAVRLAASALRGFTADVHAHASGRPCRFARDARPGPDGLPGPAVLPVPSPSDFGDPRDPRDPRDPEPAQAAGQWPGAQRSAGQGPGEWP